MTEDQLIREIILGILNDICGQQHYTIDVTLLCANGKVQVSSVVVAAIFTIFREILRSLAQPMLGQSVEIAFPELDSAELESLYQCLLKPTETLHLNIFWKELKKQRYAPTELGLIKKYYDIL